MLDEVARSTTRSASRRTSCSIRGSAQAYGVDKAPAIVILATTAGHADADVRRADRLRVRRLVEAILVAGTGKSSSTETMNWIQAVDKPTHIQVFSTPT